MRLIMLLLLAALAFVACDTVWDEPFVPSTDTPDAEGFYQTTAGSFTLKYKVSPAGSLTCRFSASGTGWIAVGFDPTNRMKDANYIIGYVSGTNGFVRDDWGTSSTSHNADVNLGGTDNITLLSSSESGGRTNLEFTIPLVSGDSKDRPLAVGSTYSVIFAAGNDDDFDSMHNSFASGSIKIR